MNLQLFQEIDFPCTRSNAHKILKQYRKFERIAGRAKIDIRSPQINDMPKAPSFGNKTEDAIIQFIYAKDERDEILKAITSLDLVKRQLLYYTYCEPDEYSNELIANKIGYSARHVSRLKKDALIYFAEAYRHGKLIQYY